jgi:S-adenosylmethionine-diacylglycerol 3-amino-3-carboxypropyl transferase
MATRSLTRSEAAPILERPVFERLLFAQCWEDPRMDIEALRPGPGKRLLVVTSGGCTALTLALEGAEKVIAVDLNAAQSWLLHLKIAGVRVLEYPEYLELLGVRTSTWRQDLYTRCRPVMPARARAYWDREIERIEAGVLDSGRYERYLAKFRMILRTLHGEKRIARLLELHDLDEQRRFYEEEWDTAAWRLFFRVFFSRTVLGFAGLDRAFFTYVEGISDFGEHFLGRARHVLTDLPVRDNYFLAQICRGRYLEEQALPPYLEEASFPRLKEAVRRIEVVTDDLGSLLARMPESSIDGFAYSNVFEWVPPEAFESLLRQTHRAAKDGARVCYRNLLVRRKHLPSLDRLFIPDDDLAARLLHEDRSFVYAHFEIATAVKPLRRE